MLSRTRISIRLASAAVLSLLDPKAHSALPTIAATPGIAGYSVTENPSPSAR
jgi:hypothetical protein